METLSIDPTEITPKIHFDKNKGIFIIQGKSLPEDVRGFFNPAIEWFDNYKRFPNDETIFILDFDYFNTASSKMILILLSKLRDIQAQGKTVGVTWKFPQHDLELEEAGEEFSDLLNIPFTFMPKA